MPRILALAAANSSSVSTPCVCSAARFWSCAVWSSSGGGAGCWRRLLRVLLRVLLVLPGGLPALRRARTRRWRFPRRRRCELPCVQVPCRSSRSRSGRGLACLESGFDDLGRDPDRVDQDSVRSLQGVDHLRGPEVLECDQEGRAVGRQIVADLLGVLGPQRTRLRDVDGEEGRALLVDVRSLRVSSRRHPHPSSQRADRALESCRSPRAPRSPARCAP